eukprot:TRINITY_DN6471_c0_g1_i1.p2 TRINITY_DN6471_c0_g1~~TRINITY_DN6471_c0_g1_i1.p2  ORF type:complete len:119 (-),score=12.50 TRINITY_DN6471_c0_g1_i1:25-381(-)
MKRQGSTDPAAIHPRSVCPASTFGRVPSALPAKGQACRYFGECWHPPRNPLQRTRGDRRLLEDLTSTVQQAVELAPSALVDGDAGTPLARLVDLFFLSFPLTEPLRAGRCSQPGAPEA